MARPQKVTRFLAFLPFLFVLFAQPAQADDVFVLTADQRWHDVPVSAGWLDVVLHSDQPCESVSVDPYLILLDAAGQVVAQDDDGAHDGLTDCVASRLRFQVPSDGFVLRITSCCGRYVGSVRLSNYVTPTTTTTSTSVVQTTTTSSTTTTLLIPSVTDVPTTTSEQDPSTTTQPTTPDTSTFPQTTATDQTLQTVVPTLPASIPATSASVQMRSVQTVVPASIAGLPPASSSTTTTVLPDQSSTTSVLPSTTTSVSVITDGGVGKGLKKAELISKGLRDGVTPAQQRAVVAAAILVAMPSPISVAKRRVR